ncbi:MAG TPA: MmgE/PrpD family protein [Gaiellales bacterium]|nr:MmgE/PrpD family protein [Gaiellales bacterium]
MTATTGPVIPADATARLAETAVATRFDGLAPAVVEAATVGVLDWLGVAIAGANEPVARGIGDVVIGEGREPAAAGAATVFGRKLRASPLQAALVNATSAHALDYDDSLDAMEGHATTPVLPGLIALAEARDLPPTRLLGAYVAGLDCAWLLGTMVNPAHYEHGWHATATLGALAGAGAAANLLELDRDACERCLGLAALQAAGLKSAFGTMGKPLQVGRAAEAGLLSALLVERGSTAPGRILERPQGFLRTYGADPRPRNDPLGPGEHAVERLLFKYHAACHATHPAIEAIARLRAEAQIEVDVITRIDVDVVPSLERICGVGVPTTGLEAKFTLPGAVAMALLELDTADPAAFSDRLVTRPDYLALLEKVAVHPVEGFGAWTSRVRIQTPQGERSCRVDISESIPPARTRAAVEAKFLALTVPSLGAAPAAALAHETLRLHELPSVREWLRGSR